MTEPIGWFGATVLLATIGRQVYTQWRDGTTSGLSRWLFHRPADSLDRLRHLQLDAWKLGLRRHKRADAGDGGARPMGLSREPAATTPRENPMLTRWSGSSFA